MEPTLQRAYPLSGPRAWTMDQVAEELARLLGHPVTYLDRSPGEQREALLSAGLSPLVADVLIGTVPNVPRVCDSRNDVNRRGTYRKGRHVR
jgi:uncharacterized protein YbjT (DUF2867 family)